MRNPANNRKGFTLIELLVVIAIIATLAVVVFVALDPVRRFQEARNSTRWTDVNSLLTATHESIVDTGGTLPAGLTPDGAVYQLGNCVAGGATFGTTACAIGATSAGAVCLDLSVPLAVYLKTMPEDPNGGTTSTTGYLISADTNSLVTVSACGAENGTAIHVSR